MANDDSTSTDFMLRTLKALRGGVTKEQPSTEPFFNKLKIQETDAPPQKASSSMVDVFTNCFAHDLTKKNKPQS